MHIRFLKLITHWVSGQAENPPRGKVKNVENHRQIDALGEAEGIKHVFHGFLYYRRYESGNLV